MHKRQHGTQTFIDSRNYYCYALQTVGYVLCYSTVVTEVGEKKITALKYPVKLFTALMTKCNHRDRQYYE